MIETCMKHAIGYKVGYCVSGVWGSILVLKVYDVLKREGVERFPLSICLSLTDMISASSVTSRKITATVCALASKMSSWICALLRTLFSF